DSAVGCLGQGEGRRPRGRQAGAAGARPVVPGDGVLAGAGKSAGGLLSAALPVLGTCRGSVSLFVATPASCRGRRLLSGAGGAGAGPGADRPWLLVRRWRPLPLSLGTVARRWHRVVYPCHCCYPGCRKPIPAAALSSAACLHRQTFLLPVSLALAGVRPVPLDPGAGWPLGAPGGGRHLRLCGPVLPRR